MNIPVDTGSGLASAGRGWIGRLLLFIAQFFYIAIDGSFADTEHLSGSWTIAVAQPKCIQDTIFCVFALAPVEDLMVIQISLWFTLRYIDDFWVWIDIGELFKNKMFWCHAAKTGKDAGSFHNIA